MTYFTRATAAAGVLLAAAGLLAAGPAQAAPHAHGNRLHLAITRSGTRADSGRSALLRCLPPHGHPYA
ncbi:serine protease, partial [Streptomyces sp. SID6137]|nr:serine protease [Streptomyces sp. SID6137]